MFVAIYVADRNGEAEVAARAIGYCWLEGAIAFANSTPTERDEGQFWLVLAVGIIRSGLPSPFTSATSTWRDDPPVP